MSNESHHRRQDNEPQEQPSQDLGGLLGAILGGMTEGNAAENNPPPTNAPSPQGGDQVLGSLSGGIGNAPVLGQNNPPQSAPNPNTGGMPQGGGDPLSDLLGGLLGGSGAQGGMPQQSQDPTGGLLGGLLGGLMGGGTSSNMGAMSGAGGLGSVLAPFADTLSEKLGIPRDVALTAMTILVPMLLNKLMSSGQASGEDPLGSLQKSIQSGQGLQFSKSEHDEMVGQLVSQTGLSHREASQTLTQAMRVLGSQ